MKINRKIIFLFFLLLIIADVTYGQCSMCKKVAGDASGEGDNSVGQQLNFGILYLMAIPYIILFIVFRKKIFSFFRELKNAGR